MTHLALRGLLFIIKGFYCGPFLPQLFVLKDTHNGLAVLRQVVISITTYQFACSHTLDVIGSNPTVGVGELHIEQGGKPVRIGNKLHLLINVAFYGFLVAV